MHKPSHTNKKTDINYVKERTGPKPDSKVKQPQKKTTKTRSY